jgi:hypothetical protein
MPLQSVWMIRLSYISLAVVAVSGAVLLINKGSGLHPAIWALLPVHYELAIWGWLVQFVMGTAYWIFPRYLEGEPRGPEKPMWMVVILLNTGLLVLLTGAITGKEFRVMSMIGRILIAGSLLLFALLIRKRVLSYRGVHQH